MTATENKTTYAYTLENKHGVCTEITQQEFEQLETGEFSGAMDLPDEVEVARVFGSAEAVKVYRQPK